MSSPLRPPPPACQLHQVPSVHPSAWVVGSTVPLSPLLCLCCHLLVAAPVVGNQHALSPCPVPLPAPLWASLPGPSGLDSAPLAFGRAPRPLPGAERLTGAVAANTVQVLYPQPHDPLGRPIGTCCCPVAVRGDEACAMLLLTAAPAAACSARSPRVPPALGLSLLLLQGSRLRARLSLPSCLPVSRAVLGAASPARAPSLLS